MSPEERWCTFAFVRRVAPDPRPRAKESASCLLLSCLIARLVLVAVVAIASERLWGWVSGSCFSLRVVPSPAPSPPAERGSWLVPPAFGCQARSPQE